MPSIPLPTAQARRFYLAVCEHLGLDPATVSQEGFEVNLTGDDRSSVSLTVWVPSSDLVRLFNEPREG